MPVTLSGIGVTVGNKIVKDPYHLQVTVDSDQCCEDNTAAYCSGGVGWLL